MFDDKKTHKYIHEFREKLSKEEAFKRKYPKQDKTHFKDKYRQKHYKNKI